MIHHKPAPATAVMAMDIATDSEISFAHSQYDTHAISGRLDCRAASVSGNIGKRQCILCQIADRGLHNSPDTWSLAQNA